MNEEYFKNKTDKFVTSSKYSKFLLVEEVILQPSFDLLHNGKCHLIGKLQVDDCFNFHLENIRIPHLPSEFSLSEGSLSVRLLVLYNRGVKLNPGKFYEVHGEIVLLNVKDPSINHNPLTVHWIHEKIACLAAEDDGNGNNDKEKEKFLNNLAAAYQPAIRVTHMSEVDSASNLVLIKCEEVANLKLQNLLEDFYENYDSLQMGYWFQHWKANGDEILMCAWKSKYGDYMQDNTTKTTNSKDNTKQSEFLESEEAASADDFATVWESLWAEHCAQVYTNVFNHFSGIFNNYLVNLESVIAAIDDSSSSSEEGIGEVDIDESEEGAREGEKSSDFLQLLQLGLPTAFGKRRSYRNTKDSITKELTESFIEMPSHNKVSENGGDSDAVDVALHTIQEVRNKDKKKKKEMNYSWLRDMPTFIQENKNLWKYWFNRFSLFARFNEGIRLDPESWFSVTPEKVATHLAERLSCDIMIDGFCGCGGNAIQFAKTCRKVIAIDIDPLKLEMAKHNANVYGVADRIDFICGDFLHLSRSGQIQGDITFLSPPWGGPNYKRLRQFDIEKRLLPVGATELMECARKMSSNIAFYLPRNSNVKQIIQLAGIGKSCKLEHNYLNTKLVALTALYGDLLTSAEPVESSKDDNQLEEMNKN